MTKNEYMAMSLPYGLKFMLNQSNRIIELTEVCISVGIYEGVYRSHGIAYAFDSSKPILRPLSDLTKEIEHKGERFIPIVELLKIEQNSGLKYATINHKVIKIDVHESPEGNTYKLEYSEPYSNMEDGLIQFSYSERFRRFGKVMFKPYKQPLGIGFQLDMFQKLIEWHFNLLDNPKEAVDYRTLPDFVF